MNNEEFQKAVLEELKANKEFQKAVLSRFDSMENQLNENTQAIKDVEQSLTSKIENVERSLTLKIESVMEVVLKTQKDVSVIKKDLSTVETVTASNYADIIRLKSVI